MGRTGVRLIGLVGIQDQNTTSFRVPELMT